MKAFIVAAARTAGGRRNGLISHLHPATLGAAVVDRLTKKVGMDGALVDDVIFGCVTQAGMQTGNLARNVVLASETLPVTVPGTTVDRQCGSSQQAIHFAAQAVMSGTQDIVIAGGVECMSAVPMGTSLVGGKFGMPNSPEIQAKFGSEGVYSQFVGAEMICSKWNITREAMDEYAAASHAKAQAATLAGKFSEEIVVLEGVRQKTGEKCSHDKDEGIRADTTPAALAKLDTLVKLGACPDLGDFNGGRITAGNASQITDGAAAVMVVNEAGLKKLGVEPLVQITALALAGSDPIMMLSGPIPATQTLLKRAGIKIGDIDFYEVNEAFASIPMAWTQSLDADPTKLNMLGGAIALGHPLGATGAKLVTTMVHEMRRSKEKRVGLLAICEGGGTANATLLQRC